MCMSSFPSGNSDFNYRHFLQRLEDKDADFAVLREQVDSLVASRDYCLSNRTEHIAFLTFYERLLSTLIVEIRDADPKSLLFFSLVCALRSVIDETQETLHKLMAKTESPDEKVSYLLLLGYARECGQDPPDRFLNVVYAEAWEEAQKLPRDNGYRLCALYMYLLHSIGLTTNEKLLLVEVELQKVEVEARLDLMGDKALAVTMQQRLRRLWMKMMSS